MSQFQLFPPPSPKKVSKNPFRRELRRQSDKPASPIPLADLSKESRTEAVLFQIIEDTNDIKPPPKARIPKSNAASSSSKEIEKPRSSSRSQKAHESPDIPDIPMKSMFPRYNPNVSLSEQQYYPAEIDRALGPKTVPASVMNFPLGALELDEVHYASAAELQGLWEAANGQRPQDLSGTFNLRIARSVS